MIAAHSVALRGHHDDFNQAFRIGELRFDRRARRRGTLRNPLVPLGVHAREILHVGDIDLHRQQQRLVAVRFAQQAVDMAQHFARLASDVLLRVLGDLTREIDRTVVNSGFRKARTHVVTNDCHVNSC
ncbi:hypothetical protein PT2222_50095 [Paraburkholderia tropica]